MTTENNCDVIWKNNITNQEIVRNIPVYVYSNDREEAESALTKGHIVCITPYGDLAYASPYISRAEKYAESDEILLYPDGRVIKVLGNKA